MDQLSPADHAVLRAFAYRIKTHCTLRAFEALPFAFPDSDIPTWKNVSSRTAFLSGIDPVLYDCCPNSCLCYVGPHASLNQCPYCQSTRYNAEGQACRKFVYIPLIPRLVGYFKNTELIHKMEYRGGYGVDNPNAHHHEPGKMTDFFDSVHYRELLHKNVVIDGKEMPYKHFSDVRDICLALSSDGFAPFKRRKQTCWPLILYNFNLPPEIRFLIAYTICIGVIPCPKKPKDYDSYLFPAVEELLTLAAGVRAFDNLRREMFLLRAFLVLVFGDMPAMAMIMRMKGHNGLRPCRMCNIEGLRVPESRATTHYVPLNRSRHPMVRSNASMVKIYDPANLPLRTHEEIMRQGREVEDCEVAAHAAYFAKKYGVKGVPLLSYLSSLSFPRSFPADFMHLIWENVVKLLVLLWTGEFKGIDEGSGCYELQPKVWEAIGEATAASGSSLPYAFGARPPNVAGDKSACTAETWSFWTLYIAPVLLHRKFQSRKYYDHFVELVKLLLICLQFEYSDEDIETVWVGMINWVKKFEEWV